MEGSLKTELRLAGAIEQEKCPVKQKVQILHTG